MNNILYKKGSFMLKQTLLISSLLFIIFSVQVPSPVFSQDKEPEQKKSKEEIEKEKKKAEAAKKRAQEREEKKKQSPSYKYAAFNKRLREVIPKKDWAAMEKICTEAIKMFPDSPRFHYDLACAQALQGKSVQAIDSLNKAVELGFRNVIHLAKDQDLQSLHNMPEFKAVIEKIAEIQKNLKPSEVKNGVALIEARNLLFNPQTGTLHCMFTLPAKPGKDVPVVRTNKNDVSGQKINTWFREGTAAGNYGDFYDNMDGDHSNMNYRAFPQLTRIEYGPMMKARGDDKAMDSWIFFNGNVIGNASMAGHYSLPRTAQDNMGRITLQYLQYINNHIYVYPEHRDHDPPENDKGEGRGDTFPANTPYCIISQGSSGSDRPFMDAVARTFAAFNPEVKEILSKNNLLIPTVQMIFRSTLNTFEKPEEYLTGKAHPTVFRKEDMNPGKMIDMAHGITKEYIPPLVQLEVKEEDTARQWIDYFDIYKNQVLFNTPCAIARVMRSKNYSFKITVSAEKSRDINNRKLTYHWTVLRGDADRISIKPKNGDGSVAEITVPYHTRKPVPSRPEIESNRVDIGVFVNNGEYYSAPGFITFFFLDHEIREYDENHRIISIDYNAGKKRYVDPIVSAKKNWKDVYQYSEDGTLLGWKRFRGEMSQDFTAEGGLIQSRDEQGRPLSAKKVEYKFDMAKNLASSSIKQVDLDEVLYYWYKDDKDLKGEVITKEEYDKRTANQ